MISTKISIRLRTPIWTGGADQRPAGLKMSGVLGGLRESFEMLVRAHGGHTCDCTSEDAKQRCNYEKGGIVCPACLIFGCTGLGRAFKLNLDLPMVPVDLPEKDQKYPSPKGGAPSIDTWLASTVEGLDSMIKPGKHDVARSHIKNWYVAYGKGNIELALLPLREVPGLDGGEKGRGRTRLLQLLRYLLMFHAQFDGLGAKTHQGWGQFSLVDPVPDEDRQAGREAVGLLIGAAGYEITDRDQRLPSATDCFVAEWSFGPNEPKLGIDFAPSPASSAAYRSIGFALRYRLRRVVKSPQLLLPIPSNWRQKIQSGSTGKSSDRTAFLHLLFGRDNAGDKDKHAGLLGVSSLYKENEDWRVRLMGRLPAKGARYRTDRGAIELDWNGEEIREFLIEQFSGAISAGTPPKVITANSWLECGER